MFKTRSKKSQKSRKSKKSRKPPSKQIEKDASIARRKSVCWVLNANVASFIVMAIDYLNSTHAVSTIKVLQTID
jgi:hypothetical protein